MSFLGKTYTLEKQEKFDEFLASMKVSQDRINALTAEKSSQVFEKNGDTYTLTMNGVPLTFKSGVEFEETHNNRKAKTTFVVDGNTITHTQKFDDGITLNFKREFNGDKLVVAVTNNVWDGVSYRYYTA